MTELVTMATAVAAGLVANLLARRIKGWLSRSAETVYDISSPSGKKQEVRIAKSGDSSHDFLMRELVLKTLNAMQSDLSPRSKDELRNLISVLEEQRHRAPFSRQLYFALSRAYRNLGEFDRAIAVLSDYIAFKEKAGQMDRDVADAYYNRACYSILSGNKADGLTDLQKSLKLFPDNARDAMEDADLSSVREELSRLNQE